ncbi:MAG TPA: hypothetical protein VHU88_09800 [Sporichthyaceae bacterium]|nr:hypothetical protein [Sporichthyaceae bacterium]
MRLRIIGIVAVPVLIGAAPLVRAPDARAALSFTATAAAEVAHETYVVKDAPVSETIFDGGSPSARALLDAIGNSTAIAAASNPGEQITALPSTARGLDPRLSALPDYPYFAVSRAPATPKASQEVGPYLLEADSDADRSTASAGGDTIHQAGVVLAQASSLAETSTDGRSVTARAGTLATGISVAAVQIGAVQSLAQMVADGKDHQPTSQLVVTGLSVAGVPLAFGPDGLSLAGQKSPLPDDSPIAKALKEQGIGLRYLQPIITADSVLSAGVEITSRYQPPNGSPFGLTTQSLTLGRSYVSLNSSGAPAAADAGSVPGMGPNADPAGVPGTGVPSTTDAAAAPGVVPVAGSTSGLTGAGVPTVRVRARALSARSADLDLDLFPPFVVAGVGVVLLGQLIRIRGVRQS